MNRPSDGVVFDIKRYAVHDGPGIRTTVFLKGCPLACRWCHNPESMTAAPEVSFRSARCLQCGRCVEVCPHGGDALACTACGRCVEACSAAAREVVGRTMTVDAVLAEILRDELFYDESGGGATFSGGEPLQQSTFLLAVLDACRAVGVHTAVDTTLFAPWETVDAVSRRADLLLCDLKHMDSAVHERWTGVPNERILANFQKLAAAGSPVIVRIPIIPGVNDDRDALAAAGAFLRTLANVRRVDLLPYNEATTAKQGRLIGRDQEVKVEPAFETPPPPVMEQCADLLREFGLRVTIGG